MMNNRNEVCVLLDKLTLAMLENIENKVAAQINFEKIMNDGHLATAKARYIQGTHRISKYQLPTENSDDINPLVTVKKLEHDTKDSAYTFPEYFQLKHHEIDKENNYVDPIKWFGILVPSALQLARDKYKQAFDYLIELANIQLHLNSQIINILKLKMLKQSFK